VEFDYYFTKDLAIKLGARGEHNSLLSGYELSPRITLAQKVNDNAQVSFAFGQFRQELDSEYLFYDKGHLRNEKASHYLINYNLKSDKQILRLEAYYKQYDQLIRYNFLDSELSQVSNMGDGYAYGFDVFWRANQLIKNLDFWVSYSWLKNERLYRDFPLAAMPRYSTNHNLSIVGKRWFSSLKSQLSFTYQLASGRPYENPNTTGFLNERSKVYHNMSASWAYLITQQKILFVSVSNFPGFDNEFGYRYANTMNSQGIYPGEVIKPNDKQFFFIGFFITVSRDKTKNQLDNL